MNNLIIHIGTPRTGTTVIQKHLLNKSRTHYVLSKNAHESSGETKNLVEPKTVVDEESTLNYLKTAAKNIELLSKRDILNKLILEPCFHARVKSQATILSRSLRLIAEKTDKEILISSERLMDTSASLVCFSSHRKQDLDHQFPIYCLCNTATRIGQTAKITVCLREPIRYLRSKYLRTCIQRRLTQRQRDLSPSEYVQKQSILETNHPGTSALMPAMHSEFIKQLQQHAFVKAFGFQELLASDDVFSLMGLQGEDKYAFRDFPRENKLPFTKEQEKAIEIEINQALKQYGFYNRIMKAQMFE